MKYSTLAFSALASLVAAQPLKREINDTQLIQDIPASANNNVQTAYGKPYAIYQPQAFIVSMFSLERDPWLEELDFIHNITIPGLSPEYPTLHCTTNYTICQVTTGEGEINAASTITALTLNPLFDLTKTYFLIAGISGGVPDYTTIGGVTFSKYAVQLALEYEVDYTEYHKTNPNWTTGYYAYGTTTQGVYPGNVYGTEVFELNEQLRDRAVELALQAPLNNGTEQNAKFRSFYTQEAARSLPTVTKCDIATSDVYYFGDALNDYFSSYFTMMTNGSGIYCASAQEDNASLEAFVRAQKFGLVDYDRVVVMRTISNFASPPPSMANNTVEFFNHNEQGGSLASRENLVNAGLPFIRDILANWEDTYKSGVKYQSQNYVGDIYGTLGGKLDFGKDDFLIA